MRIIKFQKQNCVPCEQLGEWLDNNNVDYEAVDAFDRPDLASKYRLRSVPTLVLEKDNGEVELIKGFNPQVLKEKLL